jgi:PTH1 family peptidyl-tRNA hydrolase
VRVILGIGNPGGKYEYNRHNIGFKLLDHFAAKNSLSFIPSKGSYYYCKGRICNNDYCLIKPTTYVNNSGIAAAELVESQNLSLSDLLVVHDDINLNVGNIKVKLSGGDGGHNGINSIIYHLISNEFTRLRIGVGDNFERGEMAAFVLSDFSPDENKILTRVFESGSYLIEEFIKGGVKQILDANSLIARNLNNPKDAAGEKTD